MASKNLVNLLGALGALGRGLALLCMPDGAAEAPIGLATTHAWSDSRFRTSGSRGRR